MNSKPIMRKLVFYNSVGVSTFWKKNINNIRNYGFIVDVVSNHTTNKQSGMLCSIKRRWHMYPGFLIKIITNIYRHPDVNIVTTNPFFAPFFVMLFSRKKTKTINLIYDLYPEALIVAGIIKRNSLIAKIIRFLFYSSLKKADATVFLGERIKSYAEGKYSIATKSYVIPVGSDGMPFSTNPPEKLSKGERIEILYSGNMGHCHEVSTLVSFLTSYCQPSMNITFHSQGINYERFKKNEFPENVFLNGPLGSSEWEAKMLKSQVAIITIKPGAEHVVMPSKVYSAMLAGQAIIAICPIQSDLADLVTLHNCGWVVIPGNVKMLESIINKINSDHHLLHLTRKNSYNAGHLYYDMSKISSKWKLLFNNL